MVTKRGKGAYKSRHEKEIDSDEEGVDDRDYVDNQFKMYK